jgi:hypothetical protein
MPLSRARGTRRSKPLDSQQKIGETCRPREAREVYRKGPRRYRGAAMPDAGIGATMRDHLPQTGWSP